MKKTCFLVSILCHFIVFAQKGFVESDPFKTDFFIENKGQFDRYKTNDNAILFGIDHAGQQLFFHKNGFDILLNHFALSDSVQKARLEQNHKSNFESINKDQAKTNFIHQEWIGGNTETQFETIEKSSHYFSYGDIGYQCYGYRRIKYLNFYPNIDLEYTLAPQGGIKYSLYLRPGANLNDIHFKYDGDSLQVSVQKDTISLRIGLFSYIEKDLIVFDQFNQSIEMNYYKKSDGSIGIQSTKSLNPLLSYTIDPWIGIPTTLTSTISVFGILNKSKGVAVDFDNIGNLYVYGGGGSGIITGGTPAHNTKIAKYDPNGILLWTFMGSVPSINWEASYAIGFLSNIYTFKESGKILVGQGYCNYFFGDSSICIRLNTNGVYDNFKSIPARYVSKILSFERNCKSKKLTLFSGSIDTVNWKLLAFIDDTQMLHPEAYLNTVNFVNPITVDHVKNQNNEVFALTCTAKYKDYHRLSKLSQTKTSVIWTDSMQDYKKSVRAFDGSYRTRIYYANGDGSFNFPSLAANNSFVFSYDGRYFSAYNASNGNLLASDSFINHSYLMQSGIYADECNHVYFGGNNGNIRVLYFNGTSFIAKPDIVISGKNGKGVYDIKYSQVNRLLFVSGDSIIATLIPSQYCSYSDTIVQASFKKGCNNNATIAIHNKDTFPYSFVWRDSTASVTVRTVDSTNSTVDSFSGLIAGHWYFVEVIKCPTCGLGSKSFYFKYDSCSTIQTISICQGKTFTFNNHVYSLAGTYEDTLKSSIGADSFVTTILNIKPTSAFSQTATICQGKVYNFNSKTYSLTGIYKDTFMNYLGCDSIVTTALTVNPISQTNLSPTICEGSTYTNNSKVYAIAGIYRDTLNNFKGCDSILTITLNVLPKTYPTIFKTICKNQTLMVGSKKYSASGIYRDTLLNYLGCDSILTHNLTVLPISTHSQQVTLCDGKTYKVGNSTYSKAGVYVDTLISFRGCDSIETTVISIKNISQSNLKKEICQGEVYAFRSKILQSTGKYIDTLSNQFGCDSIITLDLLVKPVPILSLKKGLSLCEALQDTIQLDAGVYTSYLWMPDGQKTQQITITKAGVYSLEVLNDQGCKAKDSTKVLEVCKPVLFVPNAFSPNGDGRNDVFKVYGAFIKQIHWMVFNRLGELIREGRSMDDIWDGFYHGEPAPNGVYIYTVEAEGQNGDKLEEKGSLTIVR